MEILKKETTVFASISGTDYKGTVEIVNNNIERIEIEFIKKSVSSEILIEGEEQCRDLVKDLSRILKYIDTERALGISDVDFEEPELNVGHRLAHIAGGDPKKTRSGVQGEPITKAYEQ